ncbi:glucokinase [soil metagenome]
MVESQQHSNKRVGIDISNTGLTAVVIDSNDAIAAVRTIDQSEIEDSVTGVTKLVEGLRSEMHSFETIGMAVPGLIDKKTNRVAFSATFPGHSDVDLVREVTAATGVTVVLENDANAAAYGEFSLGAGRGSRDIFYVTLGDGVGGAFILNGKIWRGSAGFAGEFGYVPINSEGRRLEHVASSSNIVKRTRSRFHQDSTSSLNKFSEESITLDDIIGAAEREDDFAQMMLERTGMYIGTAIASVINLLNIEKIVIGGEIMKAKHLVLDAIIARARDLSFPKAFETTEIVQGELGTNAAAVGAAFISTLSAKSK